ncbi:NAD-dependent epimerase/dehydratase family protein [Myceligenerans halotolerans]
MRVLVLGGDGYLGWPQALYLSAIGHEVHTADNLARRRFDEHHGFDSLVPIAAPEARIARWRDLSARDVTFHTVDLTDAGLVDRLVRETIPDAIVHFGEQRSAPYSMIDRHHAVETQVNNVVGTLNVLYAMADHVPDCHLVKLGTLGEYGTPNIDIEEGYIEITHKGRIDRLPFPKQPGSFYHLSKVHDSHNIAFACRIWGIRATDLHQGIVYGSTTDQTALHPDLATRLDYDHVYGTALNRFCVQAAQGHPITIYGQGGQTRGYINIRDTMQCIALAIQNPAGPGEYRVFNQLTEEFALVDLAQRVAKVAAASGIATDVQQVANPRVEAEQHYYRTVHTGLLDLGLQPHLLDDELIAALIETAIANADRIDPEVIDPRIAWRSRHNDMGSNP